MAPGFSLIADPETTEYRVMRIASQAYTIGDLAVYDRTADAIDIVPATSSSIVNALGAVAMETVASTATQLLCALVEARQRWTVSCTNAPSTNDNYQRMLLTDKATVNNTHTDDTTSSALVTQVGVKDVTNKIIVVSLNKVAGTSA